METSRNEITAVAQIDERERNAFNFAFSELDLSWYWDEKTFAELCAQSAGAGSDPLRVWVETRHRHLLAAYDPAFLVNAIRGVTERYRVGAAAQ